MQRLTRVTGAAALPACLVLAACLVSSPRVARADDPAPPSSPPPPTGRFFEQHDKDRDGKVTKDEFSADKGDPEVFRLLDKNDDGIVTPEEVGLPPDFRPPPKGAGGPDAPGGPGAGGGAGELLRRLKAMDKNEDGKISRDEFTGEPERFEKLDRNKDGVIDAEDIAAAAREGGGGRMRERLQQRLKELDKDGDGRVSREEYSGPIPFENLDRNRDGFLDKADLAPMGERPGKGPGGPDGQGPGPGGRGGKHGLTPDALRRFDTNGDGKVTKDEFPGNEERFAELDRNHDGALTQEDVVAGPPGGRGPDGEGGGPRGPEGRPGPGPDAPMPPQGPGAKGPKGPGSGDLRAMDRDGNHKISRDEFKGSDDDWRRLDKNKDGWIGPDEMPSGANDLVRAVLEELIRRDDKNGDARIARDEFGGPGERFDALDRNHDGFLDAADGR